MLAGLLPQTVTIYTRTQGSDDAFGNPTTTETSTATTGRLRLLRSVEQVDGRDTVITGWLLYLEPGETITPASRVVIDGNTYEVDGQPYLVYGATAPHHLEVPLRETTA